MSRATTVLVALLAIAPLASAMGASVPLGPSPRASGTQTLVLEDEFLAYPLYGITGAVARPAGGADSDIVGVSIHGVMVVLFNEAPSPMDVRITHPLYAPETVGVTMGEVNLEPLLPEGGNHVRLTRATGTLVPEARDATGAGIAGATITFVGLGSGISQGAAGSCVTGTSGKCLGQPLPWDLYELTGQAAGATFVPSRAIVLPGQETPGIVAAAGGNVALPPCAEPLPCAVLACVAGTDPASCLPSDVPCTEGGATACPVPCLPGSTAACPVECLQAPATCVPSQVPCVPGSTAACPVPCVPGSTAACPVECLQAPATCVPSQVPCAPGSTAACPVPCLPGSAAACPVDCDPTAPQSCPIPLPSTKCTTGATPEVCGIPAAPRLGAVEVRTRWAANGGFIEPGPSGRWAVITPTLGSTFAPPPTADTHNLSLATAGAANATWTIAFRQAAGPSQAIRFHLVLVLDDGRTCESAPVLKLLTANNQPWDVVWRINVHRDNCESATLGVPMADPAEAAKLPTVLSHTRMFSPVAPPAGGA